MNGLWNTVLADPPSASLTRAVVRRCILSSLETLADIARYAPDRPPAELIHAAVFSPGWTPPDIDIEWSDPKCVRFVKLCVASGIVAPTRDVRPEHMFKPDVLDMCTKMAMASCMHYSAGDDTPLCATAFVTEMVINGMRQWLNCTISEARLYAFSVPVVHRTAGDSSRLTTAMFAPSNDVCIVTVPQHARLDIPKLDVGDTEDGHSILNAAMEDLDADEQAQFFVIGNGMSSLFSAVRYGAALALPQMALPEPLCTLGEETRACVECGGTAGCTSDGRLSALVGDRHTACGADSPACLDMCRQGPVMACCGIVRRDGTWFFEVSDWPLANRPGHVLPVMHPHTVLLAVDITRQHRATGRWLVCDSVNGSTSLSDLMRRCKIPRVRGLSKRTAQRADTFRGALYVYGHAMVTGHLPFSCRFLPNGRLSRQLPDASPWFVPLLQTRHPDADGHTVPHALITPGVAMTLLRLCVYDNDGYCSTLQCLQRIAERLKVVKYDLDELVMRWVFGNHPMVRFPLEQGPDPPSDAAAAMHSAVFTSILSAKTRRRISVTTAPSAWCVHYGTPVYSGSPVDTLSKVAGVSGAAVLAAMYYHEPWRLEIPVASHARAFVDVHTVLPVRVMMNPSAYPVELGRLLDGLEDCFGAGFSEVARRTWFENERHDIPNPLTRTDWLEFRSRCLTSTTYGLGFYYMATHDDVADVDHVADRGTKALSVHARMDPPVQRGVPWTGGWSVPRAALMATDAAFVDLGHGDARYYKKLLPVCRRVYAFEIDLVAIRSMWSVLRKLDQNQVTSKVFLVPVSWENLYLDELNEPCLVAAAYRPGSPPPIVGDTVTHLFTAECSGLASWDNMCLNAVDVFVRAVAPSSRWVHRTNSPPSALAAASCWKAYMHQKQLAAPENSDADGERARELAREHLNLAAFKDA